MTSGVVRCFLATLGSRGTQLPGENHEPSELRSLPARRQSDGRDREIRSPRARRRTRSLRHDRGATGKNAVQDGFVDRLRDAILRTCEKRNGVEIGDYRTASVDLRQTGKGSWHLLEEDEVFVEAAINPVVLALVRWLLGQSAVFSGQTWIIKGEGAPGLGLHSDSHGIPPGAGQIAHMCNASWVCTDYGGQDDGPTLFVPGSHHYGRATLPHEANLENTPYKFVPLIAKAGSLAIWNGATWHASAGRKNPGLRVTLVQNYMRAYMRVQHNYETTSPQLLEKYPELERVIGKALYPYENPQAPDYSRVGQMMRAGTDPFA